MMNYDEMTSKELLGYFQNKLDEEAREAKKAGWSVGLHPLHLLNFVWQWISQWSTRKPTQPVLQPEKMLTVSLKQLL